MWTEEQLRFIPTDNVEEQFAATKRLLQSLQKEYWRAKKIVDDYPKIVGSLRAELALLHSELKERGEL